MLRKRRLGQKERRALLRTFYSGLHLPPLHTGSLRLSSQNSSTQKQHKTPVLSSLITSRRGVGWGGGESTKLPPRLQRRPQMGARQAPKRAGNERRRRRQFLSKPRRQGLACALHKPRVLLFLDRSQLLPPEPTIWIPGGKLSISSQSGKCEWRRGWTRGPGRQREGRAAGPRAPEQAEAAFPPRVRARRRGPVRRESNPERRALQVGPTWPTCSVASARMP